MLLFFFRTSCLSPGHSPVTSRPYRDFLKILSMPIGDCGSCGTSCLHPLFSYSVLRVLGFCVSHVFCFDATLVPRNVRLSHRR